MCGVGVDHLDGDIYSRAQFLLTVSLVALLLTRGARIELTIGIQLTDTADKTCNIKLH
jgi:hypothetical protein